MKLTIEINCNGAAFQPAPDYELAEILRSFADRLDSLDVDTDYYQITLYDSNGNNCGRVYFENEGSN